MEPFRLTGPRVDDRLRLVDRVTSTTGVMTSTSQPAGAGGLVCNVSPRTRGSVRRRGGDEFASVESLRIGGWIVGCLDAAGLAGIWVAVATVSIFTPSRVSGSEQEHLPLAAHLARCRGARADLPVVETGSDPIRVPLGTIMAPLAAGVLTVLAGIVAGNFSRPPGAR
jgi:hypothetical protein